MATKSTPKRKTKKKKKVVPAGYDSRLEYDLHKNELKHFNYHPEERIVYEIPSTYEPDFVTKICMEKDCNNPECRCGGRSKTILVEVKGRFRERREATKYIYIRESLKSSEQKETSEEKELIFLFQDADKPMPFAQRRKDGTKQSHGEWAEKNNFRFYCLKKGLPDQWLQELK